MSLRYAPRTKCPACGRFLIIAKSPDVLMANQVWPCHPVVGRVRDRLAFHKIVACRVMQLVHLHRECPTLPCTALFDDAEWKSVWRIATKGELPASPPALADFVPLLASLGGYNCRTGDPPPGPQAIWIGIRRMMDFALAWQAFGPRQE